ncbi:MAG: HEPN domain-containing protein [Sulfurimicrobium sp.]|jgi:HEPN domain-containing protein|nr:HEPN domain-containing protein [Sulfurimicrobium sp.]MDP1703624.1 HEPN domain-containing protein [Sulfurimicrobium sp.]MDP2199479.1 HEPN domain-containing protein [Sulfurimicrobium sp.]MDP2962079.1 HEPN domain-containing protein [Sulfurimicrobium sp.]MDP3687947.1 HEPN domain-containing protein [Sulfurimicrobium sp.]
MADLEHARSMLRMALKDFNALVGMQDNPLFADEIFGFHIQQAVEKALKAWLCARDTVYPMTHELSRLLALLENQGAELEKFWPLVQYTLFAVQARYEEGIAELDEPIDRAAEIENVRVLLAHVEQMITA